MHYPSGPFAGCSTPGSLNNANRAIGPKVPTPARTGVSWPDRNTTVHGRPKDQVKRKRCLIGL